MLPSGTTPPAVVHGGAHGIASSAIPLQGIVGSAPWNALVFNTLYLQLLGMTDFQASLISALFLAGTAIGALVRWWPQSCLPLELVPLCGSCGAPAGLCLLLRSCFLVWLCGTPRECNSRFNLRPRQAWVAFAPAAWQQ